MGSAFKYTNVSCCLCGRSSAAGSTASSGSTTTTQSPNAKNNFTSRNQPDGDWD
jgi:hypothetical protein